MHSCTKKAIPKKLAERVGFEPTVRITAQQATARSGANNAGLRSQAFRPHQIALKILRITGRISARSRREKGKGTQRMKRRGCAALQGVKKKPGLSQPGLRTQILSLPYRAAVSWEGCGATLANLLGVAAVPATRQPSTVV